jgi:hypothetical protein
MFALTLVLLIPIGMIKNLVGERAERQQQAVSDIAASTLLRAACQYQGRHEIAGRLRQPEAAA